MGLDGSDPQISSSPSLKDDDDERMEVINIITKLIMHATVFTLLVVTMLMLTMLKIMTMMTMATTLRIIMMTMMTISAERRHISR